MKRGKIVVLFVLAILSVAMLAFAGACGVDDGNTHSWATEWSSDGTRHWHACTDEGCEARSNEAECEGGSATCVNKAVCATCGGEYGELDKTNHVSTETQYVSNGDDTHKITHKCCGETITAQEPCTGGEATCVKKAVCEHCGEGYGDYNAENHESDELAYVSNGNGTHKVTYKCCENVKDAEESCTGGEATCVKKAVCEHCDAQYGDYSNENHESNELVYVSNGNGTHKVTYKCCGNVKDAEEVCTGGEATCTQKAVCEHCGAEYGTTLEHAYAAGLDISDSVYDYRKCVCGEIDREHGFKKTVDVEDQKLYLNETTVALDLTGISAYESVKSIKLGETSLGANAEELDLGAIKEDAAQHGARTINVIVTDANGNDHEVSVSVILVTQLITTDDELKTLLYHGQTETARYGYFVLGNDIVYTGTRNYAKFFGTFDGNGHSISTTDILNGLFTYTMNTAVIKNLTIKATLNPAGSNYRTVLANGGYGSKFINVTVIYEGGVDSSVLNGCGFLFRNDCDGVTFEGLTVSAVGKKISSLLGTNLKNSKFSGCTVYADEVVCLAGKADGTGMVGFDAVTGIEHKNIQPAEIKLWQENPSVAYEFGDKVVTDIICGSYSFGSNINSLVIPEELIADKSKHGVTMLCFRFEGGSSAYLPAILVTAEIANKTEFFAAVQCANGDYTEKFGYYKLANDIEFNQNVAGGIFDGTDASERKDGLVGFRGTLDGNGYTLKTIGEAKVYNGGFFGLIGKDAVIKNVKFNVAMAGGAYGLIGSHGYLATVQDVEVTLTEAQTAAATGVFFAFFSGSMSYKRVTVNAAGLDLQTIFGVKVGYSVLPSCEGVVVNAKTLVAICKKGWGGDPVSSLTGFTFNVVE